VGSYLGYVFSKLINLTGLTQLPVSNFTMVGMAGILRIISCPLTAIFLIAEITGGYSLMLPLMLLLRSVLPYQNDLKDIPWM
jgi:CIC family chloride channel protein